MDIIKEGNLGLLTNEMLQYDSFFYIGKSEVEIDCVLKEDNIYNGIPDEYLYLNDRMRFVVSVFILDEQPYEYIRRIKNINRKIERVFVKVLLIARRDSYSHYSEYDEQRICWIQESDLQMFEWETERQRLLF